MIKCTLQRKFQKIVQLQALKNVLLVSIFIAGLTSTSSAAIRNWMGFGVLGVSTDLNLGLNWSGATALLPTDDLVITITGTAPNTLSLSANLSVNSITILTTVASPSGGSSLTVTLGAFDLSVAGLFKVTNSSTSTPASRPYTINVIVPALHMLTIGGNLTCSNTNGSKSINTIGFDNSGTILVVGTTILNSLNSSTNSKVLFTVGNSPASYTFSGNVSVDDGTTVSSNSVLIGSNVPGTTGTFKFGGDLSIGVCGASNTNFTAGTVILDKPGVQTITYNNTVSYFRIPNLVVGSTNSPTVILAGTVTPDNIMGNFTINGSSIVNLGTRQWNRNTDGGIFTMAGTSQLLLGAASSVTGVGGSETLITGSNFPSGFTSLVLGTNSTIEYNGGNAINQTIYAPVTYGNLALTNSTGSGTTTKSLTASITGIAGNLTVNSNTTFDQATFTANRTSAGGIFAMGANAIHKISGNNGGQAGSNFPLNFSSSVLNATSTTEYNSLSAINQTVYAPVTYGNLVLTNNSGLGSNTKSLTASLMGIAGNLTVNPNIVFDPSSFSFNRTAMGGSMTLSASAYMRLSGSSGGQPGSNFPLNFSSVTLDPASTVEYYGGSQSIFGSSSYGNLTLSGTGTKTAPAILTIQGNFSKISASIFAHNSGQVNFIGTSAQLYTSVAPIVDFFDLSNGNLAGLNVKSDMGIAKSLTLVSHSILNLFDTGSISLRSTAAQTAYVAVIPAATPINYTGTGRFIVERFINSGGTHGKSWQLLSTPVQSEATYTIKNTWQENGAMTPGLGVWLTSPLYSAGNFDGYSLGPSIKQYNSNTNVYDGVTNTSAGISDKNGYYLYVRGDRTATYASGIINSTTLRTKGKLFDINTSAPSVSIPANSFGTVGNPYAAAIDLRQLRANSSNITGDIYIWDPTLGGQYGSGGFRTISYVAPNYIITPVGGIYPSAIMNEIESGQAFFAKSNLTGAGVVQFSESYKATTNKLITKESAQNTSILRATLSAASGESTTLLDGAMAVFNDKYSNAVDDRDAVKFSNGRNGVSFKRDAKLLAVERRMSPALNDTLFINTTATRPREYIWNISAERLRHGACVAWLWDQFLDLKTPLDLEGNTAISFQVTSNLLSAAADRFKIIFCKTTTTPPVSFISATAARKKDHTVALDWRVKNETNITRYEVDRSADGQYFKNLLEARAIGVTDSIHDYSKIDLSAPASADYYRIRAINRDGVIESSNILKVAAENLTTGVSVYPNPVVDHVMHLHFYNVLKGRYSIQLTNSTNQVVYAAQLDLTGLGDEKNIRISNNIAAGTYQLTIAGGDNKSFHQQVILE